MWANKAGEKKCSAIDAGKLLAVTMEKKKQECDGVLSKSRDSFLSCLVVSTAGKHGAPFQLDMVFLFHPQTVG